MDANSRLVSAPAPRVVRWIRRIVAGHVVLFAVWTIACHLTVLGRGDGHRLFLIAAVIGALLTCTGLALWRARALGPVRARIDQAWTADLGEPEEASPSTATRVVAAVGVASILVCWAWLRDPWWVWLGALVFVGAAMVWELVQSRHTR